MKAIATLFIFLTTLFYIASNLFLLSNTLKSNLKDFNITFDSLSGSLFSNIKLVNFSYQNLVKSDIDAKINLFALLAKRVHITDAKLNNLYIDEALFFIGSDSNESNESVEIVLSKLDIDKADINTTNLKLFGIEIEPTNLKVDNFSLDFHDFLLDLNGVANLKTNFFDANLTTDFVSSSHNSNLVLLSKYQELNITNPIFAKLSGDFTKLGAKIELNTDLSYQKEFFKDINITLDSNLDFETLKLTSQLKATLSHKYADAELDTNVDMNLDNIEETLHYVGDLKFVTKEKIHIDSKFFGDFKYIKLDTLPKGSFQDVKFDHSRVFTFFYFDSLEIKSDISLNLDTNISKVTGDSSVTLNLNDINSTLKYSGKLKAFAFNEKFKYFEDFNIKLGKLSADFEGKIDAIDAKLDLEESKLLSNSKVKYLNSTLSLNFLNQMLRVTTLNFGYEDNFSNITSSVKDATLTRKNHNIKLLSKIEPKDKRVESIDLVATLENRRLNAKAKSKSFNLNLVSNDFDNFSLNLDSKLKLKEFDIDMLDFILNGSYKLSSSSLNSTIQVNRFQGYGNSLSTNKFSLNTNGKNLYLDNLLLNLKGKIFELNGKYIDERVLASLKSNGVSVKTAGSLNDLNFDIVVDSLDKLQSDIQRVYDFKKLNLDGSLVASGNLKDFKYLKIDLDSKEIKFEDLRFKNIQLKTDVVNRDILVKKFDFHMKSKEFEDDFNLSSDAKISFVDEKIVLNRFNFNDRLYLDGVIGDIKEFYIKSKDFKFAKDGYGRATIDSDTVIKIGDSTYIKSDILLKDGKVTYRVPKGISIKHDEDIIILDKNDKKKEKNSDSNLTLDISIKNDDSILFYNDDGKISLDLKLNLYSSPIEEFYISGDVKLDKGYYIFEGKKFFIESSLVRFVKSDEINPILNLTLRYEEVEKIFIYIKGLANRPNITFASEPYMTQKDILSILLFGKKSSDFVGGSSSNSPSYSKSAMVFLSNSISKDLAKSMGIDDIAITNNANEIAVAVKKQLTDNLSINYKNSSSQNSIILEYDINKNVGFESEVSDQSNSVGIFYKKEF